MAMTIGEAIKDLQQAIAAFNFYAPITVNDVLSAEEQRKIRGDERWKSLYRDLYAPKLADVRKAAEQFCKVYDSKRKGDCK